MRKTERMRREFVIKFMGFENKEKVEQMKEFDTYLTKKLICPYCGKENYDETTEPDGKTVCSECGNVFEFQRDYTISYISKKVN